MPSLAATGAAATAATTANTTQVSPTALRELYAQVWRHAEGARARFLFALSLLGSSQLLKLGLPWLTAQAINAIQTQGPKGLADAALWIGAIVVLNVGVWMLHGPGRILERGVALRVRRSVADELYGKLAHAPLAWHEQRHSGDLQHRVGQASGALSNFTQNQFVYLQTFIYLVGPLVALTLLSPLTGALALLGFFIVGVIVLRFDLALMRLAVQQNDAERRYLARLLDFVGNISAVASLRLQRSTRALLDARMLAMFAPLKRSILLVEGKWCAVDLLTMGLSWTLVVVYAMSKLGTTATPATLGSAAPVSEVLLIGNLLMAHQYAQQASGVLVSMAANFQGLAHMRADFASGAPIRQAPNAVVHEPATALDWRRIDIHDLTFTHVARAALADATSAPEVRSNVVDDASRPGIHGINLRLNRGDSVALVGPSGCGKSTLMRVLAGLYEAQHGRVSVDGEGDPKRRHAAELATLIPQEAEIFEASVRDNLTLGQATDDAELQRALVASALDDVVQALPEGMQTLLSERGANLSGGQRQRLALARGLLAASRSSLLLLDEPTSALDALTEQHVFERLRAAHPKACIVASVHRLSLLSHFDCVVFMHAGRVTDVGTAAELEARQPLFAAMRRGTGATLRS